MLDAMTGQVVGSIPLGDKPEFAIIDGKGRVYVNLENTGFLAALDARTLKVGGKWPLAPCQEP